ncbi:hypothetical protein [Pseudomonas sp. R32]|uniref:hypothetical protein n=1 Tax=Pseudomonas sp. R32 TaxID=1573704 RepID=UPI00132E79DC|nr:hypothetical protein [Pseudomonas sp. R32]QHF27392.1 hypothetical protein PspR32_06085 [Pseudomonas sp. R32]
MSTYGLLVRNAGGDVIIDSTYRNMALLLEQQISVTTTAYYTLNFPTVTSDAPPVLAVRRWENPGLFFNSVQFQGQPGNWTGAILGFSGLDAHTSGTVWIRLYAYDLPALTGYGMRIRNSQQELVFDSTRLPLTFMGELEGKPENWVRIRGQPFAGAGRIDVYRPAVWNWPADVYLAVGLALDLELGMVRVNGNPYRALVYICWGFATEGWPLLMQRAYAGVSNAPGIPDAVYYSMPAIPVIRV